MSSPISAELIYGTCGCEYPCSCVELRGLRYRNFEALLDDVVANLDVQAQVRDFHAACDLTIGDTPRIRDDQLRADLILEEARETAEAITGRRVSIEFDDDQPPERERSLAGAIDGLCDLLAVVYGAAVTFGIDLAPFWEEVHLTNMAKAQGPKRADGKQLKPAGWRSPNITGLLSVLYPGVCRGCGCTIELACEHEDGRTCGWAEPGLCTACAPGAGEGWQHPDFDLLADVDRLEATT